MKTRGTPAKTAVPHGGFEDGYTGVDDETLEVRAAAVVGSYVGDAPSLLELFDQIPADLEVGGVTADGAYDTRKPRDAFAGRGADTITPTR